MTAPQSTRAYSGSGAVETEFGPVDSNEDSLCRRGGGLPAAHLRLYLGAFVVELRCLSVNLDQLIQRCGLSVRYLKPTPLNQVIEVSAEATELDEKRTEVKAVMRSGETTTATAEAIFVRVDRAKFGFESP